MVMVKLSFDPVCQNWEEKKKFASWITWLDWIQKVRVLENVAQIDQTVLSRERSVERMLR